MVDRFTPALNQFADPQPGQGLSVGTLVAR
jgi:hypothetical protein